MGDEVRQCQFCGNLFILYASLNDRSSTCPSCRKEAEDNMKNPPKKIKPQKPNDFPKKPWYPQIPPFPRILPIDDPWKDRRSPPWPHTPWREPLIIYCCDKRGRC